MTLSNSTSLSQTNPNYPDHIVAHIDRVVGLMQRIHDQPQHQTQIAQDEPIGQPIDGIPRYPPVRIQTEHAAIETEMCLE